MLNSNDSNYTICSLCNSLVDKNNIFNFNNKEICKTCIEKNLKQSNVFSPLATFMCSLIPGFAHIFLGKKQKGIFLLTSFFLSLALFSLLLGIAFLADATNIDELFSIFFVSSMVSLVLPITIYIYSLIDSNFSRKYIENNVYIEDFVDRLAYKFSNSKNKKYLKNKIIDKRLQ